MTFLEHPGGYINVQEIEQVTKYGSGGKIIMKSGREVFVKQSPVVLLSELERLVEIKKHALL